MCTAKIENNATNTTNRIEKSGNNTALSDAKPAASSNTPTYAPAPSFLSTGKSIPLQDHILSLILVIQIMFKLQISGEVEWGKRFR